MKEFNLSAKDISRLRELGKRKLEIANDPVNLERKQAWYNYDSGNNDRTMVLAEFGGIMDEKRPIPQDRLQCRDEWAKGLEYGLLVEIYRFDKLKDDHVIEPVVYVPWDVTVSNYGVEKVIHKADDEVVKGAVNWDAPIKDLQKDFDKLKPRTYSVDRETSIARKEFLSTVFDGILEVDIRRSYWWTQGMTGVVIDLIGLENLMLFMYDDPEGLHRLMGFLRDDLLAFARWLEEEGLLCLNNKNDYIGSGSMGYTERLPQHKQNGSKVAMNDLWLLLESQETVLVGPEHFAEFIFPYQENLASQYGLVYYGCCEPVNNRWHILEKMSNLSRVSVSPWCDEEFMAEALGRDFGYSRKPNPTLISTDTWDEDAIRNDIRKTLNIAKNCRIEIIMKDVHTLNNEPERINRWVEITREEINRDQS